jgi:hypothetical protein
MKIVFKISELLDSFFFQDVGAENIVKVISDNGRNYILAGNNIINCF